MCYIILLLLDCKDPDARHRRVVQLLEKAEQEWQAIGDMLSQAPNSASKVKNW